MVFRYSIVTLFYPTQINPRRIPQNYFKAIHICEKNKYLAPIGNFWACPSYRGGGIFGSFLVGDQCRTSSLMLVVPDAPGLVKLDLAPHQLELLVVPFLVPAKVLRRVPSSLRRLELVD